MSRTVVKYSLIPTNLVPRVLNSLKQGLQPSDRELKLLQSQMNQILNDSTLPDDYKSRQFSNLLLDFLFFKYGSSVSESSTSSDTGGRTGTTTTSSSKFTSNSPTPSQYEIFNTPQTTPVTPQKLSRRSKIPPPPSSSPITFTPKEAPAAFSFSGRRSRASATSSKTSGDQGITTPLMMELLANNSDFSAGGDISMVISQLFKRPLRNPGL